MILNFWECGRIGKSHSPPKIKKISQKISSSSAGGRWDCMVLKKKAETGIPHTSMFTGMWNGWGTCLRTVSQLPGNVQFFERGYSSRSLIDLPPPAI
tara:strand:- start:752 stop:1042 length:291 start_codon:yes stop_codon:yes gene_type:complete